MARNEAGSSAKRGTYRKYNIKEQKSALEDAIRLGPARREISSRMPIWRRLPSNKEANG
jgi:hypothetical protein